MGLCQKSKARAKINKNPRKFNVAHHPTPTTFSALRNTQSCIIAQRALYAIIALLHRRLYTGGAQGVIHRGALTRYTYICHLALLVISC
jgi:hypothetical protein